jgi:hypothetical protein
VKVVGQMRNRLSEFLFSIHNTRVLGDLFASAAFHPTVDAKDAMTSLFYFSALLLIVLLVARNTLATASTATAPPSAAPHKQQYSANRPLASNVLYRATEMGNLAYFRTDFLNTVRH